MFGGYLKLHIKNQAITQLKKALNITTVFFITKHDLDKLDGILCEFFPEKDFVVIKEISKINQKYLLWNREGDYQKYSSGWKERRVCFVRKKTN